MVQFASTAATALDAEGIRCTVIDPRTTSPLDTAAILASVEKTGRLVVVDEASPRCGMTADISALVADKAFRSLRAPIRTVTPPHTPVPFAAEFEDFYIPNPAKIQAAVTEVVRYH
jgi:pyruvate dehydrogenase E1 component beta subunit